MKKIAVILCGSGFKDGSEIRESVGVLWALSKAGAETHCYSPAGQQIDVINCLTGDPMENESRNLLVEAARIARGAIRPLDDLNPSDFDAIIMPGGFGVAKNLSTFATEGGSGSVNPTLQKILTTFHASQKPIGAVCISPAVVAMALRDDSLELTLGHPGEAPQEIEKLGHKHIATNANECIVDTKNKVVSTPAYMIGDAKLHDIFEGIEQLVGEVIKLC